MRNYLVRFKPRSDHFVVLLSATLYDHGASLQPGVRMGTSEGKGKWKIGWEATLLVLSCHKNYDKLQMNRGVSF